MTIRVGNNIIAGHLPGGSSITVDSAISSTSENPVQNKVIYTALSGKQDVSNLVTSISSSSTDTQYPSAKCIYDNFEAYTANEVQTIWNGVS